MISRDLTKFSKILFLNDKIFSAFESFLSFNQSDKIYFITYCFFRFDDRFLIILKKTVQTFKKAFKSKKMNNYLKKLTFKRFFCSNNRFIRCLSMRRLLENINFRRFLITFKF